MGVDRTSKQGHGLVVVELYLGGDSASGESGEKKKKR